MAYAASPCNEAFIYIVEFLNATKEWVHMYSCTEGIPECLPVYGVSREYWECEVRETTVERLTGGSMCMIC